jgi:hypothetical protein
MHLCFVDESGTPAKPGRDTPRFFTIAGVIIPEERWHSVANRLQRLKTRTGYRGELKWRFFAPNNKDEANAMVEWSQDQRNEFREQVFTVLTADRSIRIVAAICEASAAYALQNVKEQDNVYVVADHRGRGSDEKMRLQHQRLVIEERAYTSRYNNLIEGLFLAPSHLSVGIQMADMVAGAIWRRFEHADSFWYDKIRSLAGRIRNSPLPQSWLARTNAMKSDCSGTRVGPEPQRAR